MDAIDWAQRPVPERIGHTSIITTLRAELAKVEVRLVKLRSEIARNDGDEEALLLLHRERAWCERTRDDLISGVWLFQGSEQTPLMYATDLAHARQR